MRANLLHGATRESNGVEPVAMLYLRQHLHRRASGPALRELVTLAIAVDQLLRARPSRALDTLLQRFKAVEAGLMGAHWSVAQRLRGIEFSPKGSLHRRADQDVGRTARRPESCLKGTGEDQGQGQLQGPQQGLWKRGCEGQRQAEPEGGSPFEVGPPGIGRQTISKDGCVERSLEDGSSLPPVAGRVPTSVDGSVEMLADCGAPTLVDRSLGALGTDGISAVDGEPAAVVSQRADDIPMSGVDYSFPPLPPPFVCEEDTAKVPDREDAGAKKECAETSVDGRSIACMGGWVAEKFLEVVPLRSSFTAATDIFPLPTSFDFFGTLWPSRSRDQIDWMVCVARALNSFWGGDIPGKAEASETQIKVLNGLLVEVERFCNLGLVTVGVDWSAFFAVRSIDYKGEEVKTARWIRWENIAPALPKEIGAVLLEEVCSLGCREYVVSFDRFLKPPHLWGKIERPKVMVEESAWGELCGAGEVRDLCFP